MQSIHATDINRNFKVVCSITPGYMKLSGCGKLADTDVRFHFIGA